MAGLSGIARRRRVLLEDDLRTSARLMTSGVAAVTMPSMLVDRLLFPLASVAAWLAPALLLILHTS